MGYEQAGSAAEHFDGVRKAGGHHRDAGGHGFDEHAGGDLFTGVVRQHDDVGGADEAIQRGLVAVDGVVPHGGGDAQLRAELVQPGPVRLAVPFKDLGVGPARDGVGGAGHQILELGQRAQRPFNALARAE